MADLADIHIGSPVRTAPCSPGRLVELAFRALSSSPVPLGHPHDLLPAQKVRSAFFSAPKGKELAVATFTAVELAEPLVAKIVDEHPLTLGCNTQEERALAAHWTAHNSITRATVSALQSLKRELKDTAYRLVLANDLDLPLLAELTRHPEIFSSLISEGLSTCCPEEESLEAS